MQDKTRRATKCTIILGLLVVLCVAVRHGAADEADWSVGVASVKVTPDKPVVLAGYAARTRPFESVEQDIYAKALALKDAAGHRAVLVTMDLCTMPPDVSAPVLQRIARQGGLEPAQVVLSLSHSHSAPVVSLGRTEDPVPSGQQAADTAAYTRSLQDKLVEVAGQALAHLAPARLSWGSGVCSFVMNRRQFTDKGVILGVNPRGLVDRSVPVLRIDSADGKVRAVLFGYGCHNTTLPSKYLAVSGDYAGYAKAYVQEQFPGAEALFMMGCGGDANPEPREQIQAARDHGQELGREVCRVLNAKLQPVHGPLACAAVTAELPLKTPSREELQQIVAHGPGLQRDSARQMLAVLDRDGRLPASHPAPVEAWQFGKDLTFIALPDEVVVEYIPDLERAVGPMRLWVAGYCQEVAGYIPSRRILEEGGYETRGLYIGAGWFSPEVEDVLTAAARDAAVKAGREIRPTPH